MSKQRILRLTDATIGYDGSPPVVANIHLQIHEGDFFLVLGPNMSGKTTLTRVLASQIPLLAGNWTYQTLDGAKIQNSVLGSKARAYGIGLVPQENSTFPTMSVEQNLSLLARTGLGPLRSRRRRVQALKEALARFPFEQSLPFDAPIQTLSGGAQQLVLLVSLLSEGLRLLVLDEPTGALDDSKTTQFFDFLRRLRQKWPRSAFVVVTPDLAEARRFADEIRGTTRLTLEAGHLVAGEDANRES